MLGAAKNRSCADLLGIQMLPLLGMEKKKMRGEKKKGKTKPSKQKLGNAFCRQSDPDLE